MTVSTEIGQTTATTITVRGLDLSHDILGKLGFVEAFVLCAFGRRPSPQEAEMLNALLVLALDHGLTPSSIAARLTCLGAPDAMQGAVAAGLLGAGSRYLGPATLVSEQLTAWARGMSGDEPEEAYARLAADVLSRPSRGRIFGFGHPIHKEADPRVAPLREIARRTGFHRAAWRLLDALADRLKLRSLPLNASGALGATIVDMQLPPAFASGLALVGRCAGLVAHLLEEQHSPTGQEIWELVLRQDPRNDLGQDR
ncbi:MAG TPA: citryl-CoA lyase [Burkholderiaceae bacterium]|nr:citryl-CoA lyase [Burkholderiaceae bacterium]